MVLKLPLDLAWAKAIPAFIFMSVCVVYDKASVPFFMIIFRPIKSENLFYKMFLTFTNKSRTGSYLNYWLKRSGMSCPVNNKACSLQDRTQKDCGPDLFENPAWNEYPMNLVVWVWMKGVPQVTVKG